MRKYFVPPCSFITISRRSCVFVFQESLTRRPPVRGSCDYWHVLQTCRISQRLMRRWLRRRPRSARASSVFLAKRHELAPNGSTGWVKGIHHDKTSPIEPPHGTRRICTLAG